MISMPPMISATATESAHVTDVVQSMALGAPHVSVVLSRDGRVAREPDRPVVVAEHHDGVSHVNLIVFA